MTREINLLPKNFRDEEKKIRAKSNVNAKEAFHEPGVLKRKPSILQTPPKTSPPRKSFFEGFLNFFKKKPKEKKAKEMYPLAVSSLQTKVLPPRAEPLPPRAEPLPPRAEPLPPRAEFLSLRAKRSNPKEIASSFTAFTPRDDKKNIWHEPKEGLEKIIGTDFLLTNFSDKALSGEVFIYRRWKYIFYLSMMYFIIFISSWGISWKREQMFALRAVQGAEEYNTLASLLEESKPRFETALKNALKVKLAGELLSERTDWMKIFEFLSENTVNGAHYREFRSNGERGISLKVEANSYETFVNQLVVFDHFPHIVEHYTFGDIHAIQDDDVSSETILVNITLEFSKNFFQ